MQDWYDHFPARITSVALVGGWYAYSFVEQVLDPNSPGFLNLNAGRTGSSKAPAYEINNTLVTVGTVVPMRFRGIVSDLPTYEFSYCCAGQIIGSGSTGSSGCCSMPSCLTLTFGGCLSAFGPLTLTYNGTLWTVSGFDTACGNGDPFTITWSCISGEYGLLGTWGNGSDDGGQLYLDGPPSVSCSPFSASGSAIVTLPVATCCGPGSIVPFTIVPCGSTGSGGSGCSGDTFAVGNCCPGTCWPSPLTLTVTGGCATFNGTFTLTGGPAWTSPAASYQGVAWEWLFGCVDAGMQLLIYDPATNTVLAGSASIPTCSPLSVSGSFSIPSGPCAGATVNWTVTP